MLVLLVAQARQAGNPPPRIALAAPTGRAAERMAESVRTAIQALPALGIDQALLDHLPTTGTTLHRLLGTIPDSPRFRHHADTIGRAHVCTPVTNDHLVCSLPLEKKTLLKSYMYNYNNKAPPHRD